MCIANFHHIHLNASDKDETLQFYQKYFGAKYVKYRNKVDALFTEKSFLLVDHVNGLPPTHLGSSLWHFGWAGVDGPSEFNWRVKEGIRVHTEINPLRDSHWMYFYGPDNEVVEVFTGNKNHSFEHIHLLSSNVEKTTDWFKLYLGLAPENERAQEWSNGLFKWNVIQVNHVNLMVNGRPIEDRSWFPSEFKPTDGTVLDHIAFSFENIEPVYKKMKSAGVDFVKDISTDPKYGFISFFVRGPDHLLVEIVEEKPIPEGIWS